MHSSTVLTETQEGYSFMWVIPQSSLWYLNSQSSAPVLAVPKKRQITLYQAALQAYAIQTVQTTAPTAAQSFCIKVSQKAINRSLSEDITAFSSQWSTFANRYLDQTPFVLSRPVQWGQWREEGNSSYLSCTENAHLGQMYWLFELVLAQPKSRSDSMLKGEWQTAEEGRRVRQLCLH